MKQRTPGFLSEEKIDHDSEPFDYIQELHGYLWRFVRAVCPGASGCIDGLVDDAIDKLERQSPQIKVLAAATRDMYEMVCDEWPENWATGHEADVFQAMIGALADLEMRR